MEFKVIHIVSSLAKINFGIWNAAIIGSDFLFKKYFVISEVWICSDPPVKNDLHTSLHEIYLGSKILSDSNWNVILEREEIRQEKSIVVTHGCWLLPTRYGRILKKMGFTWIYVPHGMLEPWSMKQGLIKKYLYWYLLEKKWVRNADLVRAVSTIEQNNLQKTLNRKVHCVENGVVIPEKFYKSKKEETFLFLSRLHYKKGILPLVQAWCLVMHDQVNKNLVIAGPDEGELKKIRQYLGGNIKYIGSVYGQDKAKLLAGSHYFLLPSFSEGFPTSVLEAMSYGLIPLISKWCNFETVFTEKLGYECNPDRKSITGVLEILNEKSFDTALSDRNRQYIERNFSQEKIGEKLYQLYKTVISGS